MSGLGEALALLDAYVEQWMLASNAPVAAIALTHRDGLLRASAYGYAVVAAQNPVVPPAMPTKGDSPVRDPYVRQGKSANLTPASLFHQPSAKAAPKNSTKRGYRIR
jgi:hypothetical protein